MTLLMHTSQLAFKCFFVVFIGMKLEGLSGKFAREDRCGISHVILAGKSANLGMKRELKASFFLLSFFFFFFFFSPQASQHL